jgi:hypothetical protein
MSFYLELLHFNSERAIVQVYVMGVLHEDKSTLKLLQWQTEKNIFKMVFKDI